jgi:hypothetical protein
MKTSQSFKVSSRPGPGTTCVSQSEADMRGCKYTPLALPATAHSSLQPAMLHYACFVRAITANGWFGLILYSAGYLFPEIARRRNAYVASHPDAKIVSLGIGDTTQPIPTHILSGLERGVSKLGNKDTYSGMASLRLCAWFPWLQL